jgi:hypothetical protein
MRSIYVTPNTIEDICRNYFLVFIFLDLFFITSVYFFFSETANTPLEEVARLFGDEVARTLEDAGRKEYSLGFDKDDSTTRRMMEKGGVETIESAQTHIQLLLRLPVFCLNDDVTQSISYSG